MKTGVEVNHPPSWPRPALYVAVVVLACFFFVFFAFQDIFHAAVAASVVAFLLLYVVPLSVVAPSAASGVVVAILVGHPAGGIGCLLQTFVPWIPPPSRHRWGPYQTLPTLLLLL